MTDAEPEPALASAEADDGAAAKAQEHGSAADLGAPPAPAPLDPQDDPDIIKFPGDVPKKEVWEVEAVYDWEKEERGFIFEERLEKAEEMKKLGNLHFRAEEWDLALRRYRRALYHGHIDEMQMFDLGEKHKEDVTAVHVPCKLNLAFCIVRMTELGEALEEGALDQAEEAVNEVLKMQPSNGKAYFRRAQIALVQLDLQKAKEALERARQLSGSSQGLHEAKARLNTLLREERARDRELYGGAFQKASVFQAHERRTELRHTWMRRVLRAAKLTVLIAGILLLCALQYRRWRAP